MSAAATAKIAITKTISSSEMPLGRFNTEVTIVLGVFRSTKRRLPPSANALNENQLRKRLRLTGNGECHKREA